MKKILLSLTIFGAFLVYVMPAKARMLAQEIEQRQKEKRKKKPRSYDGDHMSTMTYDKLQLTMEQLLKQGDVFNAIKYLEEMVRICDDHAEKQRLMILLGDLWFGRQDYKHAARVYEHFTELYPGSEKVEYALYRAIDCSFHQISNADRDQTDTEKTLALVNKFLERSDLFSNYLPQVTEIGTKCKERLFESEMNVFSFYVGRGNFKSAQHRLENITKVYTPQLPNIEPQILHLKIELAQATNDTEGLIKTRIELAEKFPENSFAKPLVTQLPQLKLELAALTKPAEVSTTQAAEDKNIQQHMAQRF